MKSRKLNIILIATVTVIWTFIIIRFVRFSKSPVTDESLPVFNTRQNVSSFEDTVELLLDYPDPFIKIVPVNKKNISSDKTREKKPEARKTNTRTTERWPQIIYSGMITQVKNEEIISIFKINNKKYICSELDSAGKFKVNLITPDTLYLSLNNIIKGIPKIITK